MRRREREWEKLWKTWPEWVAALKRHGHGRHAVRLWKLQELKGVQKGGALWEEGPKAEWRGELERIKQRAGPIRDVKV